MSHPLKVLIVDRHSLVREGLRRIVAAEAGFDVVGLTGDGMKAVEMAAALQAEVVILDATLSTARETTRRLVAAKPPAGVLILALDSRVQEALRLLKAGASGYLSKNASVEDLTNAVRHAGRGEMVLGPAVARGVVEQLTHLTPRISGVEDDLHEGLTARELEVLHLLCRGEADKQIAQTLHLSIRTVQGHLRHIYAKLGVHSRTEAMHLALARGWVTLTVTCFFLG